MNFKKWTLPLLVLACFTALAFEVPYLSGPVVDQADLLSSVEEKKIRDVLDRLNGGGKIQMAVLVPQTLQELDIESYSIQVVEAWKLGKEGQDQGVLLTIAPRERRMRLEVGYGLEGILTDATTNQILDLVLTPYFKRGFYADGILAAIELIAQKLEIPLDVPIENRVSVRSHRRSTPTWGALLLYGLLLFFLLPLFFASRIGRRRAWGHSAGWGGGYGRGGFGGGGFGGGFGGGGGGFGGGGASGSW